MNQRLLTWKVLAAHSAGLLPTLVLSGSDNKGPGSTDCEKPLGLGADGLWIQGQGLLPI